MKQAEDDRTIDLIEGDPVKMTRTNADRAKAMGYEGPKERPACRSCKFLHVVVHFADTCTQFERQWCQIGGFRVKLGGCCDMHARGFGAKRETRSGGEWS